MITSRHSQRWTSDAPLRNGTHWKCGRQNHQTIPGAAVPPPSLTSEEAAALRGLMTDVVEEGTASRLSGLTYTAAGKTGSAEFNQNKADSPRLVHRLRPRRPPGNRRYRHHRRHRIRQRLRRPHSQKNLRTPTSTPVLMEMGCRCLFCFRTCTLRGGCGTLGGFFCSSLKNGVFLIVPKTAGILSAWLNSLTQRPLAGCVHVRQAAKGGRVLPF